jgi:hypothetical protein
MRTRFVATILAAASLLCAACGGGTPRSTAADLVAIRQPTPDPTLDAVVRDLPRALAGVIAPTATPTAMVIAVPKPVVVVPKPAAPTVAPRLPTPTPSRVRR